MAQTSGMTQLLKLSHEGDQVAHEQVLQFLYDELHQMARRQVGLRGETLRPTALVNEVYIKLFKGRPLFEDCEKLLAYAAVAMRQVIVNYAQREKAQKRGGDRVQVTLNECDGTADSDLDFVALNQALEQLEKIHPRHARILGLYFFAGFKNSEIAHILEVSEATVYKDLRFAKAWVLKKLSRESS